MRFAAAITPISVALLVAMIVPVKAGAAPKLTPAKIGRSDFVPTAPGLHGAPSGQAGAVWNQRLAFAKPRKLIPPKIIATRKVGSLVTTRAAVKMKSAAKTKRRRAPARLVAAINLTTQRMSVKIDGVVRQTWKISSGKRGFFTPRGTYTPYRMHTMWYSRKYNNAKMPHSVFYSGGFAVHGTYAASRLGRPASHGCVRLSLKNARKFFNLVKKYGRSATRVTITGSTPRGRSYARRSPAKQSHRHARRSGGVYRAAFGRRRGAQRRSYARKAHFAQASQPKSLFDIIFQ